MDLSSLHCLLVLVIDYDRRRPLCDFLICDDHWIFLVGNLFNIKCS
jgi:hypothetical protein